MVAPVFYVFGRYTLRVAYIFSTNNAHYILSTMILPQLEAGNHGFEVAGMFFFVDNTFMLVKENEIGERLSKIARNSSMLLMGCNQCMADRKIAGKIVDGAVIGCFPELHEALDGAGVDQVITL